MLPVEAAAHALADDEHRRRGAVVGAEAAVLFDPASELGEDHHRHLVGAADPFDILHEPADRVGGVHEQPAVEIRLLHVGVERVAGVGDVVQPRRHAGRDEGCHPPEVAAEAAADAVVDRRLIAGGRLAHEVGALGRVLRRRGEEFQRRVRRRPRLAQLREHALLVVGALTPEARRVVEHERRMLRAAHRQRLRVAEVDDHVARLRVVGPVGQPAEPSERVAAVGDAGVPETHRREVRQARMIVAAAVHDAEHAVLVQPLEADHRGMKAEPLGGLEHVAILDPEIRPGAVIRRVAVRHDRVQPVVAAGQLDDDENALGVLLDARAFERLRRERGRCAAQDERQAGADADAVQSPDQEIAARAEAA